MDSNLPKQFSHPPMILFNASQDRYQTMAGPDTELSFNHF